MPVSKPSSTRANKKASTKAPPKSSARHSHNGSCHYAASSSSAQTFDQAKYRNYQDLCEHERKQTEVSFTFPVNIPLQGQWARSEDYWLQKDREMSAYLEVWPLERWLIDSSEARDAYNALEKRQKLRDQGESVYSNGIPSYRPFKDDPEPEFPHVFGADVATMFVAKTVPASNSANKLTLKLLSKPSVEPEVCEAKPIEEIKGPPSSTRIKITRPKRKSTLATRYHDGQNENHPPLDHEEPPLKRQRTAKKIHADDSIFDGADYNSIDVGSPGEDTFAGDQQISRPRPRKISTQSGHKSAGTEGDHGKEPSPPPYRTQHDDNDYQDLPWETAFATTEAEDWDDSIYEPARLQHLAQVHERNRPIVSAYMIGGRNNATQRRQAAMKVQKDKKKDQLPLVGPIPLATKPKSEQSKSRRTADQREHFTGRLVFSDDVTRQRFEKLPYGTIEAAVEAAMRNPFDDDLKTIEVTYDPGDSILKDLDLPRISIVDIARTRLQMLHIPIITIRAAECIIDFCPDLLIGFRLMQVLSESSFSNNTIQLRLGYNGSMLSDSTLAKRITTAIATEHNKTRAAAAHKKDNDYHKEHRKNYIKYKTWRTWKRENSNPRPSTFNLVEAARKYANGQEDRDAIAKQLKSSSKRKSDGSMTTSSNNSSRAGSKRSSFVGAAQENVKAPSQTEAAVTLGLEDMMATSIADEYNQVNPNMAANDNIHPSLNGKDSAVEPTGRSIAGAQDDGITDTACKDKVSAAESVVPKEVKKIPATVSRKRTRVSSLDDSQSSLLSFFTPGSTSKRRRIRR
ncbi:Hypothetical protein D9617_18g034000 [Elsinoe fawcettii]|nr:Hypothetical protein D9617_18g034000 [Elsinoe fawcettii]